MRSAVLTKTDVQKLLADASPVNRAETASKVASAFSDAGMSPEERKLATEIFRIMTRDAEVRVRKALADSLKANADLPHDVALRLARDVAEVASPILEASTVLTDDDLEDIVRSSGADKQSAIARRSVVSERISGALIETGDEGVVATLVANDGATISDAQFDTVVTRFPTSARVQTNLVGRKNLPIKVAERLVTLVSEHLRTQLVAKHRVPPEVVENLLRESRESATIGLLGPERRDEDVELLVRQLKANGRLTDTIMLRAVCLGDMRFVEASLAVRADIPLENAQRLIDDVGRKGLRSLLERAGLPKQFFPVFSIALDVCRENAFDGLANDRERFASRMIERVLSQIEDVGAELSPDDIDYLISKLDQFHRQASAD